MRNMSMAIVVLTLLAGCFDFEPVGILGGPAGVYTVDLDATKQVLVDQAKKELDIEGDDSAEQINAYLGPAWGEIASNLSQVTFVLDAGGTWESRKTDDAESPVSSGTWELADEELTIRTLVENGVPLNAPNISPATYRTPRIYFTDESGAELVLVRR